MHSSTRLSEAIGVLLTSLSMLRTTCMMFISRS